MFNIQKKNIVIALDGPAGVGKSTTARVIALKTGCHFFDSGAIYRAITYFTLEIFSEINQENINNILSQFKIDPNIVILEWIEHAQIVFLNHKNTRKNITQEIRTKEITNNIKLIASHQAIRSLVNNIIRNNCKNGSYIIDGRDIGTVVFPETQFKYFLTADLETRVTRRADELQIDLNSIEYQQLFKDIQKRDQDDRERKIAPLQPAKDAVIIDSSKNNINEVADLILNDIKSKF